MRILLAAVNAKYIHSNLAIRSLKTYAEGRLPKDMQIQAAEYTINHRMEDILQDLYKRNPDFLGFSCYIWNISLILDTIKEYKKVRPGTILWLGGPEAGHDAEALLHRYREVDGIMIGEGEELFVKVLKAYSACKTGDIRMLGQIKGAAFWQPEGGILLNPPEGVMPAAALLFPYSESELQVLGSRIVYYESSRGCPFSCSYCLSSVDKTVRYKEIGQVYQELAVFIRNRVKQVKFVDRTFNAKKSHVLDIWKYIKQNDNGFTNFHFEIAAGLLSQEELHLLRQMRAGLIQLESGIQSVHEETLEAVGRKMDLQKAFQNIREIGSFHTIHQHLDLIAGLPYEGYQTFRISFNAVYGLKPQQLQLGFLKVLKGSPIADKTREYGIVYQDKPPYEVLYTRWLSYGEVIRLKGIEEMVEVYYNSQQFQHVLSYLLHFAADAFALYEALAAYYEKNGLFMRKHNRIGRYEILLSFFKEISAGEQKRRPDNSEICAGSLESITIFSELLEYDIYLREEVKNRPWFLPDKSMQRDKVRRAVKEAAGSGKYQSGFYIQFFSIDEKAAAETGKMAAADKLLLFDYGSRNPMDHNAAVCEWQFHGSA